jgi:hypothetical protein
MVGFRVGIWDPAFWPGMTGLWDAASAAKVITPFLFCFGI